MELAHPLDGLDAHPWADTSHAYGSADDLPHHLRALAGGDDQAAEQAISELYGSVLHQGTVYAASAEVAPFLARVAAAGHRTADVLILLGGMAESRDEHRVAPGAVRAAVARQLPLMLPQLDAPDAAIRQAAAWAVARTGDGGAVLPVLRRRWESEREPLVRAELLGALARVDPVATTAAARASLDPAQPPQVRVAAVFACLDAGLPWSPELHTAVLALLPADGHVSGRLDEDRTEPLYAITAALLRRDTAADREAAAALLDTALRDPRPEVRSEAVWAADNACRISRGAPARLLPAIVALAADAETLPGALSLLAEFGPAAAEAAPALAGIAAGDGDLADRALAALVRVAPGRATRLLARDLARRPRALDQAAGFRSQDMPSLPFDAALLEAVRLRLTADDLCGNEPVHLTGLLARWGARSAPALPELYASLSRFPHPAARAVAAIAADCPAAERERAAAALRDVMGSGTLAVAQALYALTGESGPLLDALARLLAGSTSSVREAADAAREAGPAAAALAPALRAFLRSEDPRENVPALEADVAVAAALWELTQDAEAVLPVLETVFSRTAGNPWYRWTAVRAARAAAVLGPAGRPLVPRLASLLDDPDAAPAAVLALLSVAEPGSLDRSALAGAALRSAEHDADAAGACEALEALGAGALTPDHIRRLTDLAQRDPRVVRSGLEDRIVRDDERLRRRAGLLLAAATTGSG
ncbi:hypothetical protein ABZ883_22190 [Streptomyces sp. NPDC046977]|uniref:hypothetical protein n=1 Tax=Streptomyces sp. NPDC046977 TaxID=3154703 RepID=UPI0033D00851